MLGGGGHGLVVADAARASARFEAIVFFDDAAERGSQRGAWPVLGGSGDFAREVPPHVERIVAIGDNARRDQLLQACLERGARVATVVHPAASVSPGARLGRGSFVAAGAVVAIGAEVGAGGIINHGASVDHECVLGRAVHVSPGARLGGGVRVGDRSWVGIAAAVRHAVTIGADVVVGAGAVVVADVSDNMRLVGNPARPLPPQRHA
ncbi:MAG: NeuD/PglB/VioB family sugar acetyltransferase [Rubrivivax sp.]|nr:NeuD/PglB/VioB family sugar acetyltransferase [Rubrivivax sp.]